MPLARIDLMEGKPAEYKRALADGVYGALLDAVGAPEKDQFAVVSEHGPEGLVYSPDYLDVQRTDDVVFVQIMLNEGRSIEKKKALYAAIVERFAEKPGIRPEDVVINLVEVPKANWSYGNGEAQYVVDDS